MKLFKLSALLMVVTLFLFSCSSDDDNSPTAKSITLTASKTTTQEKSEKIAFSVKTDFNKNVTDECKFFSNDKPMENNFFYPDKIGTYKIKAVYNKITSNILTINVTAPVKAITLSVDFDNISTGDKATFKVMGDNGEDVTASSKFYVNTKEITGYTYTTTTTGELKVIAKYKDFTSNEIKIKVTPPINFQNHPIIEDYTGTWCGWCPRVAYAIEEVEKKTDKVFAIATHKGDGMQTDMAQQLMTNFNVTGFPTAIINRDDRWKSPEPSNLNQVTDLTAINAKLGLAITSKIDGENIKATVKVKSGRNFSNLKLVVYLLENGIKADQSNYTSYYGGEKKLENFVHNHVLRASFTDTMGDEIPNSDLKKGSIYTKDFDISIPANVADKSKIEIVAFVVKTDKTVINAQKNKIGSETELEEKK